MNEIEKYLDFVFKEFPESKEILTEKKRLRSHMEDIYTESIIEGMSKVDALKAALDSAADSKVLRKKNGIKNKSDRYQTFDNESIPKQIGKKISASRLAFLLVLFFCITVLLLGFIVIK